MRLRLAPWFSAAFDMLVALRDIGYQIRDIDVDRLVEGAVVVEHPELT